MSLVFEDSDSLHQIVQVIVDGVDLRTSYLN